MLIDIIKFVHLLITLAMLGTTSYCLVLVFSQRFNLASPQKDLLRSLNKSLLYLAFLAILTGSLLIYPKHFTLHTPWIRAAYALMGLFSLCVFVLFLLNHRRSKIIWSVSYLFFFTLLVLVVHDAVLKSTFLF